MSPLPGGLSQDQYGGISGSYTITDPNYKWDNFYRTFDTLMNVAGIVGQTRAAKQAQVRDDATQTLSTIAALQDPWEQELQAHNFLNSEALSKLEKSDPQMAGNLRTAANDLITASGDKKIKKDLNRNELMMSQEAQIAAQKWMGEMEAAQQQAAAMGAGSLPGIPAMPQLTPSMANTFVSYGKTPDEIAVINKGLKDMGLGGMDKMGVVNPEMARTVVAKQEEKKRKEADAQSWREESRQMQRDRHDKYLGGGGGPEGKVVLPPINAFEINKPLAKEANLAINVLRAWTKLKPVAGGKVAVGPASDPTMPDDVGMLSPAQAEASGLLKAITIMQEGAQALVANSMKQGLSREQAEAIWQQEMSGYLAQFIQLKERRKKNKKKKPSRLQTIEDMPG